MHRNLILPRPSYFSLSRISLVEAPALVFHIALGLICDFVQSYGSSFAVASFVAVASSAAVTSSAVASSAVASSDTVASFAAVSWADRLQDLQIAADVAVAAGTRDYVAASIRRFVAGILPAAGGCCNFVGDFDCAGCPSRLGRFFLLRLA